VALSNGESRKHVNMEYQEIALSRSSLKQSNGIYAKEALSRECRLSKYMEPF
jgi:hypothetical protein